MPEEVYSAYNLLSLHLFVLLASREVFAPFLKLSAVRSFQEQTSSLQRAMVEWSLEEGISLDFFFLVC